jgi:sugar lactone lactonase YvrE
VGRGPRALVLAAALVALLAVAPSATAAPDCPEASPSRVLLSGQGMLESVIVDPRGRLFFTSDGALMRLDRPGEQPRLVTPVEGPGGLAIADDGDIVVGFGNGPANGAVGDLVATSGLLEVDPDTGATEVYATGLSMANGLVRGPDGAFYATNDFGSNVDRVVDGRTTHGWAKVDSGNGVAIDSTGRWLYVAQTFRPAAIARVDLADPSRVTTHVLADPPDWAAGLDGMAIDAADRLFAAANGAGQVWRVEGAPARICVVLRGLAPFPDGPSAVAVGRRRTPFPAANLYVVTFGGDLVEIQGAAATRR